LGDNWGQVFDTLFKHLAVKGRLIIVGGIAGYKTVWMPEVSLNTAPSKVS
jgi:NADPH-dependent curcumin reductase CurA